MPAPIYAAAGNGEALAFVTVTKAEGGQPRRWALLVTDIQGKTRFQVDLGASPAGSGEDWLEALVEAKNLAISWFEPLVAVGGAKRVSVWNYAQGQLVFSR